MPRPITITQDMKQQALDGFLKALDGTKMSNGKISYSTNFTYEDGTATVWLTQEAYKKIVALVTGFSDEVGWHGTVSRFSDRADGSDDNGIVGAESRHNDFIIEDIFVYPQEVTGSTVNTDQEAYSKWLYELDDDTFRKIRMQGHSHCSMGVTPSGVDDKHRQQILEQLEPDMFYIFMIWNRSLSFHTLIYDMSRNVLYEDKDVEVKLLNSEEMEIFLEDAKDKVQKSSGGSKKNNQWTEISRWADDSYWTESQHEVQGFQGAQSQKGAQGQGKRRSHQQVQPANQLELGIDYTEIELLPLHEAYGAYDYFRGKVWQ